MFDTQHISDVKHMFDTQHMSDIKYICQMYNIYMSYTFINPYDI